MLGRRQVVRQRLLVPPSAGSNPAAPAKRYKIEDRLLSVSASKPSFRWDDPFLLDDQLSDEERMIRDAAHGYAQEKLLPCVLTAAREERFDREIMNELGALGFLGSTIDGYGCARANMCSIGNSSAVRSPRTSSSSSSSPTCRPKSPSGCRRRYASGG